MRYFQHNKTGVAYPEDEVAASVMEPGHPHFTEVQVVPSDAIVIRRDELPEVEVVGGSRPFARASARTMGRFPVYSTASFNGAEDALAHAEARALEFLALREYLREHPPVDEAQVEALARILAKRSAEKRGAIGPGWRSFAEDARHLVAHGVRAGEA